jgi:hypothetical protein
MSDERWIVIPNWRKFQHYHDDRQPAWIKLYTELEHKIEFRALTDAQVGLLVRIWIQYALQHGRLKVTPRLSYGRARDRDRNLKALNDAGFIEFSSRPALAQKRSTTYFSKKRSRARAVESARARAQREESAAPDLATTVTENAARAAQLRDQLADRLPTW